MLAVARGRAPRGVALKLAAAESLPLLAHHARAAGDAPVCVRFSKQATRNALDAHAPEEVMRVVDLALPAASTAQTSNVWSVEDRAVYDFGDEQVAGVAPSSEHRKIPGSDEWNVREHVESSLRRQHRHRAFRQRELGPGR